MNDSNPRQPGLNDEQVGILMRGIDGARVATRSQSGRSMSYVEAYDIKATLIRIFGFGGFSAEVINSSLLRVIEKPGRNDKINQLAICQSTVRLTIHSIGPEWQDAVYTETAVGSNEQPAIEEAIDTAMKSASSDALKRCAIYLGDQFGLSLYKQGSKDPLVRWMFDPIQKDLLAEYTRKQIENPPTPDASTQQALARATGQT